MKKQKIKNPAIIKISHITFICRDLAKTTVFLKELFDAKEVYASKAKIFSLSKEKFFKIGDLWIVIMEGNPIDKTYNHIAFEVDSKKIKTLKQKIKKLGLSLLPGRDRKRAEGESLYFYDYDNHLFELHAGNLEARLKFYEQEDKKQQEL